MIIDYLQEIKKGKYTLIVRKDNRVIFKSNDSGIKGLLLASQNGFLKEAIVYDKTVGLAAAKITIFSGAKELHALLASKLAATFCQKQKFPLRTERMVEKIYNFQNKNECYLEKIAQKINNLSDLINHFEKIYETQKIR